MSLCSNIVFRDLFANGLDEIFYNHELIISFVNVKYIIKGELHIFILAK